jgi:hypothetical protein
MKRNLIITNVRRGLPHSANNRRRPIFPSPWHYAAAWMGIVSGAILIYIAAK